MRAASVIGVLPRKKGDIGRKERRAPAGLPVSRPVEPATQKQRDRLLAAFKEWLRTQGLSFGIFLEGDPDVDSLNSILVTFGKQLYEAGRSHSHYSETINSISAARPRLRRSLQQAWDLAFSWRKEEPPQHHVALPWQVLVACVSTALVGVGRRSQAYSH